MHTVYLGIGTNLGDRMNNLQQAISNLSQVMTVTAVSPIYETEPWGVKEQPAFLNMCVSGTTVLNPNTLLNFVKNLETEIGREKTSKWGPRVIDIDILLYNEEIVESNHLVIPHPFMAERAFVLGPLADIAPDAIHPGLNKTIAELNTAVDHSTLQQIPEFIGQPLHI